MKARPYLTAARIILAIWIVALFLPVAVVNGTAMPGYEVGGVGWLGTFDFQFGWWANLALLVALRLASDRAPPGIGRTAAMTILLLALTVDATFWRQVTNEYQTLPIEAFGAGYYLWFASIAAGVALLWWRCLAERRRIAAIG